MQSITLIHIRTITFETLRREESKQKVKIPGDGSEKINTGGIPIKYMRGLVKRIKYGEGVMKQ